VEKHTFSFKVIDYHGTFLDFVSRGLKDALIEYDVACQWSIHFDERVQNSSTLTWPNSMSHIDGIGKFHIGGHQPSCFPKYSLNFIRGAGQQDGEILETLWAVLNRTAGSTRAMTKFHRQEVLDDHMQDSNWKKLVNIGKLHLVKTVF
jgi:Kyakuja-Dileera-Zisupton transposase